MEPHGPERFVNFTKTKEALVNFKTEVVGAFSLGTIQPGSTPEPTSMNECQHESRVYRDLNRAIKTNPSTAKQELRGA